MRHVAALSSWLLKRVDEADLQRGHALRRRPHGALRALRVVRQRTDQQLALGALDALNGFALEPLHVHGPLSVPHVLFDPPARPVQFRDLGRGILVGVQQARHQRDLAGSNTALLDSRAQHPNRLLRRDLCKLFGRDVLGSVVRLDHLDDLIIIAVPLYRRTSVAGSARCRLYAFYKRGTGCGGKSGLRTKLTRKKQ